MFCSLKKGFDTWEGSAAPLIERALKSPVVLEPAGALLSVVMKVKATADRASYHWWRAVGLATRSDQERAMHALNLLQSRLMDFEEELQDR